MEIRETDRAWLKARRAAKVRQAEYAPLETLGISFWEAEGKTRVVWDLDDETFVALMALQQLRDELVEMEAELVTTCRAEGLSWEEIGWALGMKGSSARKRHLPAGVDVRAALVAAFGGRRTAVAARGF